jgi:hypothetical protein
MGIFPFKTNFSLIAENTTKYYMELKTRYRQRFPDDASLLAAAGILDAQNYVFSSPPQIEITDVIELALRCTARDEDIIALSEDAPFSRIAVADFERLMDSFGPPRCTPKVFEFVFGLELLLFQADNRRFSPYEIDEACRSKHKTIGEAITGTMRKYNVGKGIFARATTTFMEDVSLKAVRDALGVLP